MREPSESYKTNSKRKYKKPTENRINFTKLLRK